MKIFNIDPFHLPTDLNPSAACVGYFDGIHIGHQKLIDKCLQVSHEQNIESSFITFDPDPWTVFHKDMELHHLTTLKDKYKIVKSYGIDNFYCIHFTFDFAAMSVNKFHEMIHNLKITNLICGFDFRYSSKNSGSIETLKEQDLFDVDVIDSVNLEDSKISTSRIEPLIQAGKMKKANELLGYIYSIEGTIEHGFKRGTDLLHIPTANLKVKNEYILPQIAVYAGYVLVNDTIYKAMINIGRNPTFNNQNLTIEAHILDFNEDIYEKECRFFFYKKIRDEKKFKDFEELKNQLLHDIETTRNVCDLSSDLYKSSINIWNK